MLRHIADKLRRFWPWLAAVALLAGYWLLPIRGRVLVLPGRQGSAILWPQMRLEPTGQGEEAVLQVTDNVPWAHVLVTVNGQSFQPEKWWAGPGETWTWQWRLATGGSAAGASRITFFRDCQSGCRERGQLELEPEGEPQPTRAASGRFTKLGVAFADPDRDWHDRQGWAVELTYSQLAEDSFWGADGLATRVYLAQSRGLRVLIRVDYARDQSLPPAGDLQALQEYLAYLERLARDERLHGAYAYVIGSGYNALQANRLDPAHPVTAAWYARVFNGYGDAPGRTDNAVQTLRAWAPDVRVLVGPVQPWCSDQNGELRYSIDAPWLNYMNSLVSALVDGAQAKSAAGIPLAGPDGFAVQAPGRPDAPELAGRSPAAEPRLDLPRSEWQGAQAGFRVYRDWLGIVNSRPETHGLPVYITSANTYAPDDGAPPAQNYAPGWLTAAFEEVNSEPQVQALCWFLDSPLGGGQWDAFSLALRQGHMAEAADEFDALLRK